MIVETQARRLFSAEAVGEGASAMVREIPDAVVRGIAPFREEPHLLTLHTNEMRLLWHDGTEWRVSIPGWSASHAERVMQWPALEACDAAQQYVLADAGESVAIHPWR